MSYCNYCQPGAACPYHGEFFARIEKQGFPVGARVLVDGEVQATVKQHFPEGSSSFMFPHYKLDYIQGDRNVAVSIKRVGVLAKKS